MSEAAVPEEGVSFEAAIEAIREKAAARQAPAPESPAPAGTEVEAQPESAPAGSAPVANSQPPGPPAAAAPENGAESKPPENSLVDPALKRLLDREAALQEREKALNVYEAAKRQFKYDPVRAIKALVPDASLGDIAKALWVEELGDLAPPEAKQQKEVRGVRSEVEELRAQVQEERSRLVEESARQQQEQALHQYTGAIRSAVTTIDASKYPLVAGFQKKHSDGVVDEMLAIARNHAQTVGEILPPEQIAGILEGYLGRYQVGSPAPQPVQPKEAAPPAPTQSTSLRNSHSQVQPNLNPPNELDDEYLREQGLKAVREARARRQG